MDEDALREDRRWDRVSENFDMLFSRVEVIGANQHRLEAQMNLGNKVMEQILKDQQLLAKQIEVTGDAVARLTLDRSPVQEEEEPPSPTLSHGLPEHHRRPPRLPLAGTSFRSRSHGQGQRSAEGFGGRHVIPKMSCPTFDGSNPRIWKSKCLDYFQLCNIDEAFWATAASLNMDGNAAKWLQVYKKKHGLGDWDSFSKAVEAKFGAHDYRDAIEELLALK